MKAITLMLLSSLSITNVQAMPLPAQDIKTYDCLSCEALSHETLRTHWPVKDRLLPFQNKPLQRSQKYQIKASLKELRSGVRIYTSAPGAIIRIAPINTKAKLESEFHIKNTKGQEFLLNEASALFSKEEGLNDTTFAGQNLAIAQLKPELGFGEFMLTNHSANLDENAQFNIHVFDKNSSIILTIETDKSLYHYGDLLTAKLSLSDNQINYSMDVVNLTMVSPEGEKIPLINSSQDPNHFQATIRLDSEKNSQGENWYLEANVTSLLSAQTIHRQVHSAFSYAIPSASITDLFFVNETNLSFSAAINVATPSRYGLQAVLFGTNAQGIKHPIQTAQSSAWLIKGKNKLNFSFDSNLASNYKAPYYLGYIQLTDFGQFKPVYQYNHPIKLKSKV